MPTIISCPNCRDPVTLPAEPYSALVCPHCQAEFSMQPVLRHQAGPQSGDGVAAFRKEVAEDVREELGAGRQAAASLDESTHMVIPVHPSAQRRGRGVLCFLGHMVGLLGGGALGLAAGYYLLNWFGGPQFNVLEIPLPGIAHTQQPPAPPAPQGPQGAQQAHYTASPDAPFRQSLPRRDLPQDATGPHSIAPPSNHTTVTPASVASSRAPRLATSSKAHHRPSVSREELALALREAHRAVGCPTCQSRGFVVRKVGRESATVPCTMCAGRASKGVTPEVYDRLCHLAGVVTHFDAGEEAARQAHQDVIGVLRIAANRESKQQSIGRKAAQRIADGRRDGHGILLAGTVTEKHRQGRYYLTRLVLLGEPAPVTVVSTREIPAPRGKRTMIAGCIVADPVSSLEDYRGPRSPVAWAGLPLPLGE